MIRSCPRYASLYTLLHEGLIIKATRVPPGTRTELLREIISVRQIKVVLLTFGCGLFANVVISFHYLFRHVLLFVNSKMN